MQRRDVDSLLVFIIQKFISAKGSPDNDYMMRFFIFDLAMSAVFCVALSRWMLAARDGGSAVDIKVQECHNGEDVRTSRRLSTTDDETAPPPARGDLSWTSEASPEGDRPESPSPVASRHESEDDDEPDHLKLGGIIELYGEDSAFGVPAKIIGIRRVLLSDDSDSRHSSKYDLHSVITNTHPANVDPKFLHPYQAYDDGTEASCNVGAMRKIYFVPCTVVSHSAEGNGGSISYEVEYPRAVGYDRNRFPRRLPFSRVQRYLKRYS